jgi:ornithine cyclodeaminase/alanine dehydrogenase-like protein (mu-crystallin family)
MLPFINGTELKHYLPYPTLIEALRKTFTQVNHAPLRHAHRVSELGPTTLLIMPVWQESKQLGLKVVTVAPENRALGLPTVHALFILMDTATGVPIALMDGEQLTLRRTAAASALASDYLSRKDSHHLLLVGTGRLAPHMAIAHCMMRPIQHVSVWGRDSQSVAQTAKALREEGLPEHIAIIESHDLSQSAHQADIICCATTSKEPLIFLDWIKTGTHIDLVGGFRPDMREADDALMCHAQIFVDTFEGTLAEAGDVIQPLQQGLMTRDAVRAELADLTAQRHAGRSNDDEITVFKSVGTAIEDLCAASLAWNTWKSVT